MHCKWVGDGTNYSNNSPDFSCGSYSLYKGYMPLVSRWNLLVRLRFCHADFKRLRNRRYVHFITRTKNDQLSVDGAKLDGNLKAEVPYKSMGSKCGSSNNSPLELRAGHLACHLRLGTGQSAQLVFPGGENPKWYNQIHTYIHTI